MKEKLKFLNFVNRVINVHKLCLKLHNFFIVHHIHFAIKILGRYQNWQQMMFYQNSWYHENLLFVNVCASKLYLIGIDGDVKFNITLIFKQCDMIYISLLIFSVPHPCINVCFILTVRSWQLFVHSNCKTNTKRKARKR
jgi:hypothetical protein